MAAGGGSSQEANVPGQKLAEFCAQLDDYTPTVRNKTINSTCVRERVGWSLVRIHHVFFYFRYRTQLHSISYKDLVSIQTTPDCKFRIFVVRMESVNISACTG